MNLSSYFIFICGTFASICSYGSFNTWETVRPSCSNAHCCRIRPDKTVGCWGRNLDGESTPPSKLENVRMVQAGNDHSTCSKQYDGSVMCWGGPMYNSQPDDLERVKYYLGVGWIGPSESRYACALKMNGTVTCWNDHGPDRSKTIVGLTKVVSLSIGTCVEARKEDGTIVRWSPGSTRTVSSQI